MTHGDAVVDRNGVKLTCDTSCLRNLGSHQVAEILEVHMAWHKLGIGVGDSNHWLIEIIIFHTRSAPQRSGSGHIATLCGSVRSVLGHLNSL